MPRQFFLSFIHTKKHTHTHRKHLLDAYKVSSSTNFLSETTNGCWSKQRQLCAVSAIQPNGYFSHGVLGINNLKLVIQKRSTIAKGKRELALVQPEFGIAHGQSMSFFQMSARPCGR